MIFVALSLPFAALEVGLRLGEDAEYQPGFRNLFVADERIGYRLQPGATTRFKTGEFETDIRINASGVRDREIQPKAPDEFRVVVLGDSMVLAVQVPSEQTFCRLLEDRLNAAAPPLRRARVINAGVQGYGPVEEYLFFERVAGRFEPDLVVVILFTGNDAVDSADAAQKLEPGPGLSAGEQISTGLRRAARRSAALQFLRTRLLALGWRAGAAPIRNRPLDAYFANVAPDVLRGFDVARDAVANIAMLSRARGAQTIVVLLPARFQVDDDDFARLAAEVRTRDATLERDAATNRFRNALAPLKLPVLDLLPLFRAAPSPAGLFFRENIHLTPRGHKVVASSLEGFLHEQGLIPF